MKLVKFTILFTLYFIQALPFGFQSRYLPLAMRHQGVSITSLGLFKLLLIPWILKFLIASCLVDVYKTKKFWLLLTLLVLGLFSTLTGLMTIFYFESNVMFNKTSDSTDFFYFIAIILFVLNMASATQDICVDWLAMNILDPEDLGLGNTIQVGGFKLGGLFSGGLLVYLIDFISLDKAFLLFGLIYFVSFFLTQRLSINDYTNQKDEEIDQREQELSFKQRLALLIKTPYTVWICSFVFIYKLGEQSSLNMLPIYLYDKKVSSSQIGLWTGVYGQTASIIGSMLGGVLLKKTSHKFPAIKWLKYTVFVRTIPIILINVFINYFEAENIDLSLESSASLLVQLFSLVQVQLFLSGFLTTVTFTVMMEISYSSCEPHLQASHFSLLSTCEVLGKLLFQPVISIFTDSYGYSSAFILFTILYLISTLNFIVCREPRVQSVQHKNKSN